MIVALDSGSAGSVCLLPPMSSSVAADNCTGTIAANAHRPSVDPTASVLASRPADERTINHGFDWQTAHILGMHPIGRSPNEAVPTGALVGLAVALAWGPPVPAQSVVGSIDFFATQGIAYLSVPNRPNTP